MPATDVPNLTRADAQLRAGLLDVDSYDIVLDLTDGAGRPAERTFRSTTTIRFSCSRPGESTFVDVIAENLDRVTLNGRELDVSGYRSDLGIALPDLAPHNELTVDGELVFSNTGEGLHRFVDPIDGEIYLYTQFEAADAKRMYACFDQPDLKAAFTVRAIVPEHWSVASNGASERTEPLAAGRLHRFATTERISPYITALIAGPYHVERSTHDGIELALWCRRTIAKDLDADELFALTGQGLDWFHRTFAVRYPFGKYDQAFVPEFNAGAMENAGLVTFREEYIFGSKVTDARYERRAETLLHEMAHMWFGDLVTMRWWDDLWLNESFASYAAVLCQTEATRWSQAWTTFANVEKTGAYRQDQLPSTHPIASDAPDVQTAEVNFDGITYAKGASVLKQLVAYVGRDEFFAGLQQYFADHAFGNTTLADLLTALEHTSGRNLGAWSERWLKTAGINTLRPEYAVGPDGRYTAFALVQGAPDEPASSNVLRPHRLAIGCYEERDDTLVRVDRVELDVTGVRTEVPDLVGRRQPALLLANDDDLTYCKLRLDEHSLHTLRHDGMAKLAESLPRGLVWSAMWDMTRDGELPARSYVRLVADNAPRETDIGVLQSLTGHALRALDSYVDPVWAPTGWSLLADVAVRALHASPPGSDHQFAWMHTVLSSARSAEHLDLIGALFDGREQLPGLAIDPELRWSIAHALAAAGRLGPDDIGAELDRDPSAAGRRYAATARALLPTPEAKSAAWQAAMGDDAAPTALVKAMIRGFTHPAGSDLVAPYMPRYFAEIADAWQARSGDAGITVAVGLFPSWHSTLTRDTIGAADRFLERTGIPSGLRRLVNEGRSDVVRALHAREADAAAS